MYITPNLGLTVWDQEGDNYTHAQLQGNWIAVDDHDHGGAGGVPIGTGSIVSGAITNALMAANAIAAAQMQANSVNTAAIQEGAVTGDKLAAGAASSAIGAGTITHAMLDPNVLPLGTVMTWWRPSGSSTLPAGGWEIMDGRPWNAITNSLGAGGAALTTGNIPDMRGNSPLGADPSGLSWVSIGQTGGSNTVNLAHAHTVTSHTHGITSHTHGINSDGSHFHTFGGGGHIWSRDNAFDIGMTINDHGGVQRQNLNQTMYIKNLYSLGWGGNDLIDAPSDMDSGGYHSHGGNTVASDPSIQTASVAPGTDTQLGSIGIEPPFVGLLFIMLVR